MRKPSGKGVAGENPLPIWPAKEQCQYFPLQDAHVQTRAIHYNSQLVTLGLATPTTYSYRVFKNPPGSTAIVCKDGD